MKLLSLLSASLAATLAAAAAIDKALLDTPLTVKLTKTGDSSVHAALKNRGDKDLKLLITGTFLDKKAVEKLQVWSGDKRVEFDGIRLTLSDDDLPEAAFRTVKAGETVEVDFDAAELHDLSKGGDFDVLTSGSFAYAKPGTTEFEGVIPFKSNKIRQTVNGTKAAEVHTAFRALAARTDLRNDCKGDERNATWTAVKGCRELALLAQNATADEARMKEYFKSFSNSTRETVLDVFKGIAKECRNGTSGIADYHCDDVYDHCDPGVLAYTMPSQRLIVNCPLFFDMPANVTRCHGQDQRTTVLHEMTHLNQIRGTSDYGGYGFRFIRSLSAEQNLDHADTYTLFAQSLNSTRCEPDDDNDGGDDDDDDGSVNDGDAGTDTDDDDGDDNGGSGGSGGSGGGSGDDGDDGGDDGGDGGDDGGDNGDDGEGTDGDDGDDGDDGKTKGKDKSKSKNS